MKNGLEKTRVEYKVLVANKVESVIAHETIGIHHEQLICQVDEAPNITMGE